MHAFWVWLSNSTGTTAEVTLKDIDPRGHEILRIAKTFLEIRYGSVENAWFALLDKCPRGDVTKKNFIEAMICLGFELDAAYVFDVLDFQDRGTLYEKDLHFMTAEIGNKIAELEE